jgi:tripartite-type tricarboxylate transporter receptor subunit TctC
MQRRSVLTTVLVGLCASLAFALPGTAAAQAEYPARPIRLLHGFTAGGGVDLMARLVAQHLQEQMGQPVVVEGKPGAGGTVASGAVAQSAPDGYTLYLMASGHSIAPALYPSLPYDSVADFTMISLVTRFPFAIAVGANSPVRTINELVQRAREKPGSVSLGHAGVGTGMHLTGALLQQRAQVQFNEIPYRGGVLAPTAASTGEVGAVVDTLASMGALLQGGKLRVLAVSGSQRWPAHPDVPTIAESVSPGFEVNGWHAIAGPKNLPAAVVARLSAELKKVMAKPEVIERVRGMGLGAVSTDPEATQRLLATEVARWTALVRDAKIEMPR